VNEGAWALSPGAVNEMATRYVGSWFAAILDVVIILDAMALALAICVTIGRGYFALSRDGLLPKAFSKTSRYDTPWVANLMVAVGGIGLMLVSWLADYQSRFVVPGEDGELVPIFPSDGFATFILSATIGSFAVELVYVILAVVAFGLVRQAGNRLWQYAIVAVAVATPLNAGSTRATMLSAACAAGARSAANVQFTVPVVPTAGVVQFPPVAETNVVLAASGKAIVTPVALLGPILVTVTV
jgi:amino acid transporter